MTYRTQIDDLLLPGFCISRGTIPVNITVVPGVVDWLGKDCHRLTVRASNVVTSPDVSKHLQDTTDLLSFLYVLD